MNRRGFLGALAAVVAAGKAAPSVLARLTAPAIPAAQQTRFFFELQSRPRDEALIAHLRRQSDLALARCQREMARQCYGESTGILARSGGVTIRRKSIGFAAWERQVLG